MCGDRLRGKQGYHVPIMGNRVAVTVVNGWDLTGCSISGGLGSRTVIGISVETRFISTGSLGGVRHG